MDFKLTTQTEKYWRRLNGHQLIAKVIQGVKFTGCDIGKRGVT